MRGKHEGRFTEVEADRITPADAGKTSMQAQQACKIRDHPRRCGENWAAHCHQCGYSGSPPQVRGKLACRTVPTVLLGITPAGAGKTRQLRLCMPLHQDHPRRCGENPVSEVLEPPFLGSPPQVRGKQYNFRCFLTFYRITPAGAGKTRESDENN